VHRLLGARDTVRAWVVFTDKGDEQRRRAAFDALPEQFSSRSIARRELRRTAPGLFDERDLPVVAEYVDAVLATGAARRVVSRWVNAVSVEADRAQIEAIAQLPFVRKIQPVRGGPAPDVTFEPVLGGVDGMFYGRSESQIRQIGLDDLHDEGFAGAGMIVGVLDTGFDRTHEVFNEPGREIDVIAEYDFVDDDPITAPEPGDPPAQHEHGTLILGTLASSLPGEMVGAAFDASYILCKTEDITDEYRGEEDFYVAGLEFIEMNGGDVATSSLGYIDWYTQNELNGLIAITTIGVNAATENGVYCVTAAGNGGHDTDPTTSHLIAPADAFEVITVGAVNAFGEPPGFSSDGPTADGRVKPEVLARGRSTDTISPNNPTGYTSASGTSLSTPLVAGAVTCLAQARPTWTVPQMRNMLFETSDLFVATGTYDPLYIMGYGVIDAFQAFDQDCNSNGIRDAVDIAMGTSADINGNGVPDECECYADCDSSTGLGVLDVFDFLCFQDEFVSGSIYACDCSRATGASVCDVFDFLCFQDRFVSGCP
jgi:subtilisin family serine protease